MVDIETFLTPEETQKIIMNFLFTRGERGASEEEISTVVSELLSWKIGGVLYELVLENSILIDLKDGGVVFSVKD